MPERRLGMAKVAGQSPAAGSNKIAPVAQAAEQRSCKPRVRSSSDLGCSSCGRADYGKVGHDCDSCLLWVQLPPATPSAGVKFPGLSFGPIAHSGERRTCNAEAVGAEPTRSTKIRQSRMRGRYAPLKPERAAFNSLGWHQSGNGVMHGIRALGARGLSSILSSPTKVLSVRAREELWPSLRTKCTQVRVLPGAP